MSTTPPKPKWKRSADTLAPPKGSREYTEGYTQEEIDEVADRPALWGFMHGKIEHRLTKEAIPWEVTILQRRMESYYCHCQAKDVPCRIVALKIRRGGGSTGAEGLLYVHVHNYRTRAGLIGTDHEVSSNLMKMLKHFDLTDDFPGWSRASKVIDDAVEWKNGSTVQRYTAENPEASRSAGLQAYHASEVSRWPDTPGTSAKETLRSIRGSVPRSGFTLGVEESTANGSAGVFFDTFTKGRWPTAIELGCQPGEEYWRLWEHEYPQNIRPLGGELQFVRVFAAWFEDPEAQMPCSPTDEHLIATTLDRWEKELLDAYRRPGPMGDRLGTVVETTLWQQLRWRREVIAEEFDGDREAFDQENPHSPGSAFLSSGRHSFSRAGCQWMMQVAESRGAIVRPSQLTRQEDGHITIYLVEAREADFLLYEEPRAGHKYIIGLDTMTGEEQVKGSRVSDYNSAHVLRAPFIDDDGQKHPIMVVASLATGNQRDPDVLARQIDNLSKLYGNCLVVFEVNNSGHAYKEHAKILGTSLYRRETVDQYTQETTDKLGWETNTKTRPMLIGCLQALVRNNAREETRADGLESYNPNLAKQLQNMVKDAKGKDVAPSGQHDDEVLSLAMAALNIASATYFAGHRRKRQRPADGWQRANVRR